MSPFLLHHIGRQTGNARGAAQGDHDICCGGQNQRKKRGKARPSPLRPHILPNKGGLTEQDIKAGQCAGNLGPKQARQLGADKAADVSGAENGRAAVWPEQGGGRKAHQRRNCWQGGLRISDRSPSRRSPFSNAAHKAGRADGDQVKGALFSAADGDFDSAKKVACDHLIDIATKKDCRHDGNSAQRRGKESANAENISRQVSGDPTTTKPQQEPTTPAPRQTQMPPFFSVGTPGAPQESKLIRIRRTSTWFKRKE